MRRGGGVEKAKTHGGELSTELHLENEKTKTLGIELLNAHRLLFASKVQVASLRTTIVTEHGDTTAEKAENQFILQVEQSIYKGQHEETSDELESKKKAQVFPEKEKDEMAAKLEAALAKIEAMKLEAQAERTRFMELQITRKSDVCTNILQDGQSFQSCLS